MVGAVRVCLLPCSENLTERLTSAIPRSGWEVTRTNRAGLSSSQSVPCDVAVLVVDEITSSLLAWLASVSRNPQMPLVVIAEDHDPQTIADVLRAGADDYIVHPYASEELLARIESLTRWARAGRSPRH